MDPQADAPGAGRLPGEGEEEDGWSREVRACVRRRRRLPAGGAPGPAPLPGGQRRNRKSRRGAFVSGGTPPARRGRKSSGSAEMLRVAAAGRRGGVVAVVACRGGARALSAPAHEALSAWAPVAWAEAGLAGLQAASGLPWWATVVAAAALLRTGLTLPLSAQQGRVLAKLENLQPEIHGLARRLRLEVSAAAQQRGWSPRTAGSCFRRRLRGLVAALYVRENCHPAKASLLLWVQLPAWALVSLALRDLAGTADPQHGFLIREQLSVGGALWFMDLTAPDHTLILPIMLGLLNLLIVEIFVLQKTRLSRFQKYTTHFFRGLSVLMVPVAATVPSAMSLYWVSSSFVGLSHNLLLRSPAFRRLCRIPRTKSDSDTPYRDIIAAFCAKYFVK